MMLSYTPAILFLLLTLVTALGWFLCFYMPGSSYRGVVPSLSPLEKDTRFHLEAILREISVTIGERNVSHKPRELLRTSGYLERELKASGYEVKRIDFSVGNHRCFNLEARLEGKRDDLGDLIIGAHYDTVAYSPGANDNGTGVAALLLMAKKLSKLQPERTIRFVFFANEEMPYFMSDNMGALRYAKSCREHRENLMGMICLETIGYYTREKNSQRYPWPLGLLFPSEGNFIGFVGNLSSRTFLRRIVGAYRHRTLFPSTGVALPSLFKDAARSDHNAFWSQGFKAIMITDTANFRYPYYHTAEDTIDKIDWDSYARITAGLIETIEYISNRRF